MYLNDEAEGWEIRFQALYVRIVGVFPWFAVLAYCGLLFPWMTYWFDFIGVVLEIYVIFGFYAFLTGIGYVKGHPPLGNFPDFLIEKEARWTNRPCCCFGRRFKTGVGSLTFLFYNIVQFAIIKSVVLLTLALLVFKSGQEPVQLTKILLNLVSSASIFIATAAVLRLYKEMRNQPNSVLEGHHGLLKIVVVKMLFVFIVLNNLILRNLAYAHILPIPPSLCTEAVKDASQQFLGYCESRVINAIFIVEIVLCMIPAVISYRHHGLGLRRSLSLRRAPYFLYLVFLRPLDLRTFWNNQIGTARKIEDSTVDHQKRMLSEDTEMVKG